MNPHNKTVSIITVNRNTMAPVDVYDEDGIYMGQYVKQITLQHGYGDGKELSCERTVTAVSRLFHNLPINGYVAINMDAIPALNDAVGGVPVTVLASMNSRTPPSDSFIRSVILLPFWFWFSLVSSTGLFFF